MTTNHLIFSAFFSQHPEFNETNQDLFWQLYLQQLIDYEFKDLPKKYFEFKLEQISRIFNYHQKIKNKSPEEIYQIYYLHTKTKLPPYFLYCYFSSQYQHSVSQVYQSLQTMNNDEDVTMIVNYLFQKLIDIVINFINYWTDYSLDFFLAYCFAIVSFHNHPVFIKLEPEIQSLIIRLSQNIQFNELYNHQISTITNEIKQQIVAQIISYLPIKIKKPRYMKTLKKIYNKSNSSPKS